MTPPPSRDGFQNDPAHRIGSLRLDGVPECARALDVAVRIGLAEGTAVAHGVRDAGEPVRERSVRLLALLLSAGRQARDGGPVVVPVPVEDLVLAGPVQVRDLAHHLDRLLVGLRAAVGEVDVVQFRQPFRQRARVLGRRDGADHARVVGQAHQLLADHPRDALAPVAHVDAPDAARGAVEILVPVDVPHPCALSLHEDLRILGLEDAMLKQMVPEVLPVLLDDVLDVVVGEQRLGVGHVVSSGRGGSSPGSGVRTSADDGSASPARPGGRAPRAPSRRLPRPR